MKLIKIFILIFIFTYFAPAFSYNEKDIDLYNHSNQHGAIFNGFDKRENYDNVKFNIIKSGKCGDREYTIIKSTAYKLKAKEQPFWVYKYCKVSEYKYFTKDIIKAYHNYRFDLNKRLMDNKDYEVLDNIATYLPINIEKGSNYLYYLGMRNNIIKWQENNNELYITLPIMFSGIISKIAIEKNSVIIREIFLYDRPNNLPKSGYIDLYVK